MNICCKDSLFTHRSFFRGLGDATSCHSSDHAQSFAIEYRAQLNPCQALLKIENTSMRLCCIYTGITARSTITTPPPKPLAMPLDPSTPTPTRRNAALISVPNPPNDIVCCAASPSCHWTLFHFARSRALVGKRLTIGDPPALPKRQTPALQAPATDVQDAWDEGVLVHLCPRCCDVSNELLNGRSDRVNGNEEGQNG